MFGLEFDLAEAVNVFIGGIITNFIISYAMHKEEQKEKKEEDESRPQG